jgi:very-short-patch-repair endonuclease
MTLPERMLWKEIRAGQIGPKFRRQVPIGPYVVDFYCPQARLVVEIDGEFHGDQMAADDCRTARLEEQGLRLVRVQAVEVLVDLPGVLERLLSEVLPCGSEGAPAEGPCLDPPLRPWRATSPARGEGPWDPS